MENKRRIFLYSLIRATSIDAVAAETSLIGPDETPRFEQACNLILGFRVVGREGLRINVNKLFGARQVPGRDRVQRLRRTQSVQMVISPAALDIFASSGRKWLSTSSASTWTMQPRSKSSRSSR